jgi:hypothetical protein
MSPRVLLVSLLILSGACSEPAAPPESLSPVKPEGVLTNARTAEIVLSWRDVSSNETRYRIEVRREAATEWTLLAETAANVTSVTHAPVERNVQYTYRVAACNDKGCSDWVEAAGKWQSATNPTLTVITVNGLIATRANFIATGYSGGLTTNVVFTLTKAGNPAIVFRSDILEGFSPDAPETEFGRPITATYTHNGLEPNTDYLLYATATNTIGASAPIPPFAFRTPAS